MRAEGRGHARRHAASRAGSAQGGPWRRGVVPPPPARPSACPQPAIPSSHHPCPHPAVPSPCHPLTPPSLLSPCPAPEQTQGRRTTLGPLGRASLLSGSTVGPRRPTAPSAQASQPSVDRAQCCVGRPGVWQAQGCGPCTGRDPPSHCPRERDPHGPRLLPAFSPVLWQPGGAGPAAPPGAPHWRWWALVWVLARLGKLGGATTMAHPRHCLRRLLRDASRVT